MDFDDNLNACARMVEKSDPLRFRTVMAAPVAARAKLFPLYAFNIEVARAPWVTQEPMIAEMRLQWWRDALEEIATGATARRHEVVTPLAHVIDPQTAEMLDQLVAARRWDIYKDGFEDAAHFERYIDQTAGHLMVAAVRALGAADEAPVREIAYGAGVAAWFQAVPALETSGRVPLIDGTVAGVRNLATQALSRQKAARGQITITRAVAPALWPAVQSPHILKAVVKHPQDVGAGAMRLPSGLRTTCALGWRALTGRG